MTLIELSSLESVNLTNCDREPIHIPGLIQPHGVLMVLSEPALEIQQISDNTEILLGLSPDAFLRKSLTNFLESEAIAAIQSCLQGNFEQVNPLKLQMQGSEGAISLNGIIHRSVQDKIILELEPLASLESKSFFHFYQLTRGTLSRIQQTTTLQELCALIVGEVKALTGFDRVMVYQFDADGAGTVIAEQKIDDIESYLGLHYPSSDIPQQAKQLYGLNWLRLIPDVDYSPVKLLTLGTIDPETESSSSPQIASEPPLDLSFSVLRSVSPIHIEYLKNMGVQASMSISLMKQGKLWGLIACHHYTPQFIPYETRTVCEFLGQVTSLEIAAKEDNENLDYKVKLRSLQSQFVDAMTHAEAFPDALLAETSRLLSVVGAEGAAICTNGHLTLVGKTPAEPQVYELLDWLQDKFENYLFVTDSLPRIYSPAIDFKAVGSGLLALSITKIQPNSVLWFRPELLQQVNWAGNPDKPSRIEEDGTLTLFPRQSFELWQETVRLKSLPWLRCEVEGAIELRNAIVGIILQKADELALLNLELERSNNELDSFAYIASHDLKEPLRGIHNYATFLLEDYGEILEEQGVNQLETLVRLTKRMEDLINSLLHFSRLGRQDLDFRSIDLNELIATVTEVIQMSHKEETVEIRIPRSLPIVQGDRLLIEEILTNLVGNGLKYNIAAEKWVEIGFIEVDAPTVQPAEELKVRPLQTFYVRDNGIGIPEKHLETIFRIFKRLHPPSKYGGGAGAGLTIVRKIVERHGGTIWVESSSNQGSTFYFTLPV